MAPRTPPSVTIPSMNCHGRKDGSTPTSDVSSPSMRPCTRRKSTPRTRERDERSERPDRAALDEERRLHESVGRADETQDLDLGAPSLERETHRRATTTASTEKQHDHRQHGRRRDASANELREARSPRLVRLDTVDRRELLQLGHHVGETLVAHVAGDVDHERGRKRLRRQRGQGSLPGRRPWRTARAPARSSTT